jgi:hypothetical protein
MKALGGFVLALAIVALIVFAAVGIHELQFASDHSFRYGPAKVIASAAGGGVLLSAAVATIGAALARLPSA